MGLGNGDDAVVDDGDGSSCGDGCRSTSSSFVSCSICLDFVFENCERSWAKLQCGHHFHLDCIGSAFNIKGAMQCPNCRKIEKGQWLYANGFRSFPEVGIEERMHDEDLYGLSYSEMSFGVHWCPFGGLARLPSSFEDPEFLNTTYHDMVGQHAVFSEHPPMSSAAHPCPYVAYFGPIHPSSSNSSANGSDASDLSTRWNGSSLPNEMATPYAFPAVDLHYQNWENHPSLFATNGGRAGSDQPLALPVTQRTVTRPSSDMSRSGTLVHPFLVNHSGVRAGSSVASTMVPLYPGSNARARDRVQALEAYYQQLGPTTMRIPPVPSSRRSSSHRGMAQAPPLPSSSDQSTGFYFFPSASSGGTSFQDAENRIPGRFHHPWDIDHGPAFSLNHHAERHSNWVESHHPPGVADQSVRSSNVRQRHGSERTSSTHHRS